MSQESIEAAENRVGAENPLRMIVVGSGRGKSHARSCLGRPDTFELVGLVDIDAQRLEAAIRDLELPDHLAYTSYPQALEGSDCDGVVIATWARTHDELVEAAIEAGKHVMVEKAVHAAARTRQTIDGDGGGSWSQNRCNATVAISARTANRTTFDDRGGLWRAASRTHANLQSPWWGVS